MLYSLIALILAAPLSSFAQDPLLKLDPRIRQSTQSSIAFVALMDTSPKPGATMPRRYRHGEIVNYLQSHTRGRFSEVQNALKTARIERSQLAIQSVQYISSSFTGVATRQGLEALARLPMVTKIYLSQGVQHGPVTRGRMQMTALGQYPWDLIEMKVDQVRQANPQLLGKNVLIGNIDTGVDGSHPALAGRVKLFFDGKTKAIGQPKDYGSHGTHTSGTLVGTGPNGAPMGLAPEAQLLVAAVINMGSADTILAGMQFMLDPDNNPSTADQPRVINNSWNSRSYPDQEVFYRAIAAWEAAGILPVWSAGNSGPGFGTITPPHEHPLAFATASSQGGGKISDFSSRGPGIFQGKETQKPDVTAPGSDINSCVPGGKFSSMSGTSMASPHNAGAAAILIQLKPDLTPMAIRKILMDTAAGRDENGAPTSAKAWNRVYGLGILDLNAAVKLVQTVRNRSGGMQFISLTESLLTSPEGTEADAIVDLLGEEERINPYEY